MKVIIAVGFIICAASSVYADEGANAFLQAYSTMDKAGAQVLSDYKRHVEAICQRDVSMDELQKFQGEKEFVYLTGLLTLSDTSNPDYQKVISSIPCE